MVIYYIRQYGFKKKKNRSTNLRREGKMEVLKIYIYHVSKIYGDKNRVTSPVIS